MAMRQRGFTLVELMVTLAVLAILSSLAYPAMQDLIARNELQEAQENVLQAIRRAKSVAKTANTRVTLTLTRNQESNTATFVLLNGTNVLPDGTALARVSLPDKISVATEIPAVAFDASGMVDKTGTIFLTSTRRTKFKSTIAIVNTLGQVALN